MWKLYFFCKLCLSLSSFFFFFISCLNFEPHCFEGSYHDMKSLINKTKILIDNVCLHLLVFFLIRYLERVAAEGKPSSSLLDNEEAEAGPVPAVCGVRTQRQAGIVHSWFLLDMKMRTSILNLSSFLNAAAFPLSRHISESGVWADRFFAMAAWRQLLLT